MGHAVAFFWHVAIERGASMEVCVSEHVQFMFTPTSLGTLLLSLQHQSLMGIWPDSLPAVRVWPARLACSGSPPQCSTFCSYHGLNEILQSDRSIAGSAILTRHYAPTFCRLDLASSMGGAYNWIIVLFSFRCPLSSLWSAQQWQISLVLCSMRWSSQWLSSAGKGSWNYQWRRRVCA